ncbi:hypothetical protein BURK1_02360 [Burkholderiales bacterium]|nr:hypothetical protein BURK1_02360 [Burkholderiales bacterium]
MTSRPKLFTMLAAVLGLLAAAAPGAARGGPSTLVECIEGSEFVANAAASRDNGISRDAFLDRLEGDLAAIHAFPVSIRWFAKDADDEQFLRAAARDVFDRPRSPERHAAAFFAACVARGSA